MKENKVPNWYDGNIYKKGGEATNPLTGEKILLGKLELSIYDLIIGMRTVKDSLLELPKNQLQTLDLAEKWFKEVNPKAFKILLKKTTKEKDIDKKLEEFGDLDKAFLDYKSKKTKTKKEKGIDKKFEKFGDSEKAIAEWRKMHSNNESEKKKKNITEYFIKRKKNTFLFIFIGIINKILIHYFIYGTYSGEVACPPLSKGRIRVGGCYEDKQYTIGDIVDMTFTDEIILFIPAFFLLGFIVWYFNDKIKAK